MHAGFSADNRQTYRYRNGRQLKYDMCCSVTGGHVTGLDAISVMHLELNVMNQVSFA